MKEYNLVILTELIINSTWGNCGTFMGSSSESWGNFTVFIGIDDEKRHSMGRVKHELRPKVKELWAFSENMNYPVYSWISKLSGWK